MEQRKYMNISRLKTKDLPGFRVAYGTLDPSVLYVF